MHFTSLLNSSNWNLINSLLSLFSLTAGIPTIVTVPICHEVDLLCLLFQCTAFNTNLLLTWARFLWRRHWKVLIYCSVVNIRLLSTIFKEGVWNGFLWPTNNYNILQTCWLLHIQVLLKKLKTLHPGCFFFNVFSARIITRHFIFEYGPQVKTTWVQIFKHGGHNSLLILLAPNALWKQRIVCGVSHSGILPGGGVYVFP